MADVYTADGKLAAKLDASNQSRPDGAVIEIIEYQDTLNERDGFNVVIPNDVRINGQSLLCSADDPVIVHNVTSQSTDVVRVTLTLLAKRVVIEQRERGQ